jgi:hypothetical protein
MANTTNYNWETPDDTDLVKDGAAAIRTLGSSIDTTTKNLNPETTTGDIAYRSATANTNTRLAIGSSGQVLTVAAGVPSWEFPSAFTSPLTTKGDIYTRSASGDARLPVGTNGQTLVADSAETNGLKWVAPASGGMTLLQTVTLSGTSTTTSSFSTSYKNLVLQFYGVTTTNGGSLFIRVNSNTGNNYGDSYLTDANNTFTIDPTVSYFRMIDYNASGTNYSSGKIEFPEYANTSATTKSAFVYQTNTAARRMLNVAYITETTAISTLTFLTASTPTMGGTVLIYGVN